jgi:ribosome-associated translation inhibitor RaiA
MDQVLQITYRNVQHSDALENIVSDRFQTLQSQHPSLSMCRVVIEKMHQHHQHPRHYHVRLTAYINGKPLLVGNPHSKAHTNENPYAAVISSFDALDKQVEKAKAKYQSRKRAKDRRRELFAKLFPPILGGELAPIA